MYDKINLVYAPYVEIWKDIEYSNIKPGMYAISTKGRVMNVQTGQILKQCLINSGYMVVSLRCVGESKSKKFLIHRLMMITFMPSVDNFSEYTVNHHDCNKIHNELYNLEWMTQKENNLYKYTTNTDNSTGEDNITARITNEQAHIICQELEKGTKYRDILIKIGYNPENSDDTMYDLITNIKSHNSWNHISKLYNFDNVKYNHSNYSDKDIEFICECLEFGMPISAIYNCMHNDTYKGSKVNKSFYEMVRGIKNRKSFLSISSNYTFRESSTTILIKRSRTQASSK